MEQLLDQPNGLFRGYPQTRYFEDSPFNRALNRKNLISLNRDMMFLRMRPENISIGPSLSREREHEFLTDMRKNFNYEEKFLQTAHKAMADQTLSKDQPHMVPESVEGGVTIEGKGKTLNNTNINNAKNVAGGEPEDMVDEAAIEQKLVPTQAREEIVETWVEDSYANIDSTRPQRSKTNRIIDGVGDEFLRQLNDEEFLKEYGRYKAEVARKNAQNFDYVTPGVKFEYQKKENLEQKTMQIEKEYFAVTSDPRLRAIISDFMELYLLSPETQDTVLELLFAFILYATNGIQFTRARLIQLMRNVKNRKSIDYTFIKTIQEIVNEGYAIRRSSNASYGVMNSIIGEILNNAKSEEIAIALIVKLLMFFNFDHETSKEIMYAVFANLIDKGLVKQWPNVMAKIKKLLLQESSQKYGLNPQRIDKVFQEIEAMVNGADQNIYQLDAQSRITNPKFYTSSSYF